MGGVFSVENNSVQHTVPLDATPVCVEEVVALGETIEELIMRCSQEKSLFRSKYGVDPDSVSVASCNKLLPVHENPEQTLRFLKLHFQNRTKLLELTTVREAEEVEIGFGRYGVNVYERRVIKVMV